jgi:hypothetical protein
MDYSLTMRAQTELPPNVEPAYDGMVITLDRTASIAMGLGSIIYLMRLTLV